MSPIFAIAVWAFAGGAVLALVAFIAGAITDFESRIAGIACGLGLIVCVLGALSIMTISLAGAYSA